MYSRANRLLTWNRACFWAALLSLLYVAAYGFVLITGHPPLNSSGEPIGGDYIAFHTAGRLVLQGNAAHLYDHAQVAATQDALLHGTVPAFFDAFRNPPFFALVFAPLALTDLQPGFAIWSLLSLLCLGIALWLLLRDVPTLAPRWRGLVILVCAFGPLYFGVIDGQNSTLSLLLCVLVYHTLSRGEDRMAGVWAALGLFKPQLFVIFPIVFIVGRRWRALASYVVTALVLALISFALVGVEGVQSWLRILVDVESANATRNAWRMHSLKSFFDALLPGQSLLALGLYAIVSAVLVGAVIALWRTRRSPLALIMAFTVLAAVLIDPHLVDYDLTVLVCVGVLASAILTRVRWLVVLLYALLLFRAQIPLGEGVSIDLTVLALCVLAVALSRAAFRPLRAPEVAQVHWASTGFDPIG